MTATDAQTQGKPRIVVVDITRENPVKALDPKELIRVVAYESLAEKIREAVTNNSSRADNSGARWNVFFIDGTRGSGKSTFLQTAIEELNKGNLPKEKKFDLKLEKLAYIDPTMIQTGEHILLSLLASLDKKVKTRTKCRECLDGMYDRNGSSLEEYRKQFQYIANGLMLLGKSGRKRDIDEEYFDEIILLNEKLNNAGDGLSLKEGLTELFKITRKLLGVDAFIVGLDDVDTNFDIGWEVLETIRRYGDIPGLIFLVTGDLQLYTHLVRDRHFRNFSDSIAKNDEQRVKERARMVDHLEQQYLLKIFPLHQRTQLVSLWELLQEEERKGEKKEERKILYRLELGQSKNEQSVKRIASESGESEIELQNAVETMLTEGLSLGGRQLKSEIQRYVEYFLRLPVRSVLQILTRYHNDGAAPSNQSALAEAMRSSMVGSLYKQGIDVEAIANDVFAKLVEAVFDVTLDGGDLDTGYYLRPESGEESIRSASFVLSAEVARACRGRPDRALRYILQGPGNVSLFNASRSLREQRQGEERTVFKSYFGLGRESTAKDWALKAPSVLQEAQLGDPSKLGIGCGILKTNLRPPKKSTNKEKGVLLQVVPSDVPHENAIRAAVSYMQGTQRHQFFSFFNLLGVLEALLEFKILHTDSSGKTDAENGMNVSISEILKKFFSGDTVSVPPWFKGGDVLEEEEDDVKDDGESDDESFDRFVTRIEVWFKYIDEQKLLEFVSPSALLLGKIWARVFFGLNSVSSNNRKRASDGDVWHIMNLNIWCFLNAVLIEEALYGGGCESAADSDKISRENPSTSFQVQRRNLRNLILKRDQEYLRQHFPLFSIFASCPVLKYFGYCKVEGAVDLPQVWHVQDSEEFYVLKDNLALAHVHVTGAKK